VYYNCYKFLSKILLEQLIFFKRDDGSISIVHIRDLQHTSFALWKAVFGVNFAACLSFHNTTMMYNNVNLYN
jgi:hypothetical protein